MSLTVALLFAGALASQAPTLAARPGEQEVPPQFHGEWNANPADCGTGNNDGWLRIGPDEVRFYGSVGRVRGAFLNGPIEVVIVMDMSGEGETWMDAHHFTLASDGSYLDIRNESEARFFRCSLPRSPGGNP